MLFDHDQILAAALDRLRGKGAFSDLPARSLPEDFTHPELHDVLQLALGEALNPDTFRRKAMERDFLEETGTKRRMPGPNPPSVLYLLKSGYRVFDRRL